MCRASAASTCAKSPTRSLMSRLNAPSSSCPNRHVCTRIRYNQLGDRVGCALARAAQHASIDVTSPLTVTHPPTQYAISLLAAVWLPTLSSRARQCWDAKWPLRRTKPYALPSVEQLRPNVRSMPVNRTTGKLAGSSGSPPPSRVVNTGYPSCASHQWHMPDGMHAAGHLAAQQWVMHPTAARPHQRSRNAWQATTRCRVSGQLRPAA